ncbi:hypothetical protein GCM10022251_54080 [Phytohabitans flavus]|uniref:Malonyl CoA-acyl carrier protein transacylase n=1 Tax=Phytohabitans flavus TaxID=1076124 RepID=A0A6F8XM43_9ACTN|nr:ACP S-malonyltransferase [Phytohabitans flavus]BCB74877.1 hypothetical protein Pflav_012870 [Phytohabitans flavus]
MTVVYVFPGQGSHRVGMGEGLFERYPHLVRQADSVLGYSIAELCLRGSAERLTDTRYTQPAIYVVNALSYLERVRDTAVIPDIVAGHSVGEYAALFAGGAFDFVTGLELVDERARCMASAGPGAMGAVIGLPAQELRDRLADLSEAVDIANLNSETQTVISGPPDEIDRVIAALRRADGVTAIRLKVSGAFHSRYMAGAAERFGPHLDRYRYGLLRLPVVANATARPYADGTVADLLRRQVTAPVRWAETVRYLLDQPDPRIEEIGSGDVLTRLLPQGVAAPYARAS